MTTQLVPTTLIQNSQFIKSIHTKYLNQLVPNKWNNLMYVQYGNIRRPILRNVMNEVRHLGTATLDKNVISWWLKEGIWWL